jgi:hypothetical protein
MAFFNVKKLNEAQQIAIATAYREGRSAISLAHEFGVSDGTILSVLQIQGVPRRSSGPQRRLPTEEQKAEIISRYNAGETAKAIGASLKVDPKTFQKWMIICNLEPRKPQGEQHTNWKGGEHMREGRKHILLKPGDPMYSMVNSISYVLEHRLILARKLGRPLTNKETVHHIDLNPQNNDPANLELRHGQHGAGCCMQCANCGSINIIFTELNKYDSNPQGNL